MKEPSPAPNRRDHEQAEKRRGDQVRVDFEDAEVSAREISELTRERAALAANISWWILPFALGPGLAWLVFWGIRSPSSRRRSSL